MTNFLRAVLILIAIGVGAGMIWMPQTEGRAAKLDLISIYKDPFIVYMYIASIPFFVGLFQAFKLLNFIDKNKSFSKNALNSLRIIKFSALCLIALIVIALMYIRFFVHGEDSAGPTALGILASFVFAFIAIAVNVFHNSLKTR